MSYQSPHNLPSDKVVFSFDKGTLSLENMALGHIKKIFPSGMWKWDARAGFWRTDPIHYTNILKCLMESELRLSGNSHSYVMEGKSVSNFVIKDGLNDLSYMEDHVPCWENVTFSRINLPELRPEQKEAVERWWKEKRGVIVMPTGTGKTEVALYMISRLQCSTLVVSPVRDLMYQWHRRILSAFDYDAGVLGDSQNEVRPITVTTYDSAAIHMNEMGNQFAFIIFDECHHLPGKFFREAALMSAAPFRLGLTATPERSDGKHAELDDLIGPVVYHLSLPRVKGKTLAAYDVVRIPVHLSPQEQTRYDNLSRKIQGYMIEKRKEKPDYSWENLLAESGTDAESRAIQKAFYLKQAIEDRAEEKFRVLEDIFRLHFGSRIIVFTGTNAAARAVSLRFLIPCLLSHCKKEERSEILSGFAKGKYPAIAANRVLDEGVDVPEAKVAVVLGGWGSTRQAVQRLGRILRKTGNERAVLYEVICEATREEIVSRKRRRSEAYARVKRKFQPMD
ncbi:DEAD/DEAH box helicase [Candidatus Sumerlaeota bacterium]|nr:DEAD/DEAH box helicase [Candidatus Sumerlaeota bacterium]